MHQVNFLIVLLLQLLALSQSRLVVDETEVFDFTLARDVHVAQLWTYNDAEINMNISGTLSWYLAGDGDCVDKIILVGVYTYFNIDHFMTCGADAVVFLTSFKDVGLLGAQMKSLAIRENYTVPTFQLSYSANEGWEKLKDEMIEGREIEVTITPEGNTNVFEEVQGGGWNIMHILQYVLFGYILITLLITIEKLIFTILARRMKKGNNLVLMILSAEILANGFRAVYVGIDPVAAQGIFSVEFSFYGLQVTAPISSLTTSLLILYWFDALSHSSLFSRFKTVVFIFLGILFTFGVLVLPLLFIFAINFYVLYVMLAFYFLIGLVLAIYIFYSSPKMFAIINKLKANHQQSYTWQARTVVISGIVLICWCLSTFAIVLFARTVTGYFASAFVWLALLTTVSLIQVLVFNPEITYFRGATNTSHSRSTKQSKQ